MRSAWPSTGWRGAEVVGRRLTPGERVLAEGVFGEAVRLGAVRLHGCGFGGFAFSLGSHIFLPPHLASKDFAAADLGSQALLVHELVHVWQFQTRPAWTLASWARVVASGGYGPGLPGYRYTVPLGSFGRLNLERQASVVEHAFLLGLGGRSGRMPASLVVADLVGSPFPAPRPSRRPWG